MKKIIIICFVISIFFNSSVYAKSTSNNKNITIKNRFFAIELPQEYKGLFKYKKDRNRIEIYDKESKKTGFGGFAFGIKAYLNPKDHATLPGSRKLGELTDKKGKLYDIVLKHPTDVQYDYTKGTTPPNSYKSLYTLGDSINIIGVRGCIYYRDRGTKGKDLYKNILQKHITAIKEKWDSDRLEKEDMSYMYNVIAQRNKNILNKIGYTYYDVNCDGIEELLIGEISQGKWKGIIYDMYTMVDRKPRHVLSGGSRNRFYVTNGTFIANEYSAGAFESGVRIYILLENSTQIYPQVSFKYDSYTNKKQPYFLTYGCDVNEDKWENVTKELYNERIHVFEKYERFNFIPLSKIKF